MKSTLRLFGACRVGDVGEYIESAIDSKSEENLSEKQTEFIQLSEFVIKELKQLG